MTTTKKLTKAQEETRALKAREALLDHVAHMVDYWAGGEGLAPEWPKREALEGLAFSLLVLLDGSTGQAGTWALCPVLYDDHDEEIGIGPDIAGSLHEDWASRMPPWDPPLACASR